MRAAARPQPAKAALPTDRNLGMNPGADLVEPGWPCPWELFGMILHRELISIVQLLR